MTYGVDVKFKCRCPHGCENEAAGDDGTRAVCRACVAGWHSDVCSSFSETQTNELLWVWRFGVEKIFCGTCGAHIGLHP